MSGNRSGGLTCADAGTSNNSIQGNWIGVDSSGKGSIPNEYGGISIVAGAVGNLIGGHAKGDGNLVSGNHNAGLAIGDAGTSGNRVEGNVVGTSSDLSAAIPNAQGIWVSGGASNNTIGGEGPGFGNVFAGNRGGGVEIHGGATTGNRVLGNWIGVDYSGRNSVPNGRPGIAIFDGALGNIVHGNIGG